MFPSAAFPRRALATATVLVLAVVSLVVVPARPAHATTITVNTAADPAPDTSGTFPNDGACSLRAAMQAAQDNGNSHDADCATGLGGGVLDVIQIDPSLRGQTLALDGSPLPRIAGGSNPVEIVGPSIDAGDFVISGNNTSRVFEFGYSDMGAGDANRGVVTLANLTVTGGNGQGTAFVDGDGGAMYLGLGTELELDNVVVRDNTVTGGGRGGAIYGVQPAITNNGGAYLRNRAEGTGTSGRGGAIYLESGPYGAELTGYAVLFEDNHANHAGGAVAVLPGSAAPRILLQRSLLDGNTANVGGAVWVDASMTVEPQEPVFELQDSTATGNVATTSGGVFFATASDYDFRYLRSTFVDNTGTGGAASAGTGLIANSILVNSACNKTSGGTGITGVTNFVQGSVGCGPSIGGTLGMASTLEQNGGPEVQKTFRLLPGSAAIDSGDPAHCGTIDARSVPRGVDADGTVDSPATGDCDLGAYEYAEVVVNFATGTSTVHEGETASVQVDVSIPDPADSPLTGAVSVPVDVTTTGATASDDFTSPSTTLTIPAGTVDGAVLTYDVVTLDDDVAEREGEQVHLTLGSSSSGGVAVAEPRTHDVVIQDSDQAGVEVDDGGEAVRVAETDTTTPGTLSFSLSSQPDREQTDPDDPSTYGDWADVTASVEPDRDCVLEMGDQTAALGSPLTTTIANANWRTQHALTVRAVDDLWDEDLRDESVPHTCRITFTFDSGDPVYDSTTAWYDVEVVDDDVAGVTIVEGPLALQEDGATGSYTVELDTPPDPGEAPPARGPTRVVATPDTQCDLGNGPGTAVELAFDGDSWDVPQSVTVTAHDDPVVELDHACTVTHTVEGDDPVHTNLADEPTWERTPADVTATIEDFEPSVHENDPPQVDVQLDGGLTVLEGGTSDTVSVVLHRQPKDEDVQVTLTSSVDPREPGPGAQLRLQPEGAEAAPAESVTLTFTPDTWDQPQAVTVHAHDDDFDEDAEHPAHLTATVTSDAIGFRDSDLRRFDVDGALHVDTAELPVTIEDDDTSSIELTEPDAGLGVTEGGTSSTLDVRLGTHPWQPVTVTVTPGPQCDLGQGPGVGIDVVFDGSDWDTSHPVSVTAVDDTLVEDTHSCAIAANAASDDGLYDGLESSPVDATITDDDLPVVAIQTSTAPVVDESDPSSRGSWTVVLQGRPAGDVTVVATADEDVLLASDSEPTPAPSLALTFTSENWDQPRTIHATAIDDDVDESESHEAPVVHRVGSGAPGYSTAPVYEVDGMSGDTVTVTVLDDDTAGVSVAPAAVTVTEGGDAVTYTVELATRPTAAVALVATDDGQCDVISSTTATPESWPEPLTVTVSATDDVLVEDDEHPCVVTSHLDSDDMAYEDMSVTAPDVTVVDDDRAGLAVVTADTTLDERDPAATATYTMVLTARPDADVVVDVTAAGGQLTLDGATAQHTFTPDTWDTPRTVEVAVVDDDVREGSHHGSTLHDVTTTASGFGAPMITVDGVETHMLDVPIVDDDVPDLRLRASSDPESAAPGQEVAFELSPTNAGTVDSTDVRLTVVVPAATTLVDPDTTWTCPDGHEAGASCHRTLSGLAAGTDGETVTVRFLVDPTVAAGVDAVSLTATVAETGPDGADVDTSDNTVHASVPLDAAPDLSVDLSPGGGIPVGGAISSTVTVTNAGPQGASGVEVVTTIPANTRRTASGSPGWSCPDDAPAGTTCRFDVGSLPAGQSVSVVLGLRLLDSTVVGASIDLTVGAVDDGTNGVDDDLTDNEATSTSTVVSPPTPPPSEDPGATGSYEVEPGGTTPNAAIAVTEAHPTIVSVTSPVGGTIVIAEGTQSAPAGFSLLGRTFEVSAPLASPEAPLELLFRIDDDVVGHRSPASIVVFRNGDPVGRCRDAGAQPDPCLASRSSTDGVVTLLVRTSRASQWALTIPAPVPCPDTAEGLAFADVADDGVHAPAIDCLADRGVIHGTSATTFLPQGSTTRGDAAALLARYARMLGQVAPTASSSRTFDDVDAGVHATDIEALLLLGLADGYPDGSFRPTRPVTRGQMAAMLVALHRLVTGRDLASGADAFTDVPTDHVFHDDVSALANAGVTRGVTATRFAPDEDVTRAEVASFLSRLTTVIREELTP